MTSRRVMTRILAVTAAILVLSGCSFTGVNSYTLPLSKGGGSDAVNATVLLENATNLVPNSEVKYREVTVGSVRKIRLDGWTAKLSIGLEADAQVPADVTAKVAQKSLLGAEYLELKDPVDAGAAGTTQASTAGARLLADGDVIGLDRTSRYPETEEVLSAASLLLNGGGLPQIKSISQEVNQALSGRNGDVTSLVKQVDTTSQDLDRQRDSITSALTQIDKLSSTVNQQTDVLDDALVSLPQGIDVLDAEEPALREAVSALSRLSTATSSTLVPNGDRLAQILNDLRPVTKSLSEVGPDTAKLLENLTYPFPLLTVKSIAQGGAANVVANLTVSVPSLAKNFLGVDDLSKLFTGLVAGSPAGPAAGSGNPLTDPLAGLTPPAAAPADGAGGLINGLTGALTSPPGAAAQGATPAPSPAAPSATPTPNLLQRLLGGS